MLAKSLDGASIRFTHAEFGDGQWTTQDETILRTEVASATGLRHKIVTTDFDNTDEIATVNDGIGDVEVKNGFVLLKSSFLNTNMTSGFHVTEIGYYVRDLSATDDPETEEDETDPILYAICVRDMSEAPYVAPAATEAATFKHACHIYVGDEADVTAIIAANMEEVSKPYVDAHIQRTDNPHDTTKEHVGLGRVPNVYTHDRRSRKQMTLRISTERNRPDLTTKASGSAKKHSAQSSERFKRRSRRWLCIFLTRTTRTRSRRRRSRRHP